MTGVKVSFRTWSARSLRRGFTLTELLLVIIIIAILAAMTMTVQRSAVQSTRRERTIATIRKIDAALTSAYEKYQYRKPDVGHYLNEIESRLKESMGEASYYASYPTEEERNRLINEYAARLLYRFPWVDWVGSNAVDVQLTPYLIRSLMLHELLLADFPDCIEEVARNMQLQSDNSPVHSTYQKYIDQLGDVADGSVDSDVSADLLYLIVMNTSPETRGTFLDRETADTNGNGILEFIDGWGNPIRFIRWAPSLPNSDRQPRPEQAQTLCEYRRIKRLIAGKQDISAGESEFYDYFDEDNPGLRDFFADPFDPMESMGGWLLTPLIYSAGPDKQFGTYGMEFEGEDPVTKEGVHMGEVLDPFDEKLEVPKIKPYEEDLAQDNITNHDLEYLR